MKNITAIVLIIVSIAIIFFYIKPTFATIGVQRTELTSYNETIEQATQLEAQVKSLQAKKEGLRAEDLADLEKLLPDTISNVNLIIDINNIATDSGLRISNIKIEQPDPDKSGKDTENKGELYDSIELSFEVSAPYASFQRFITNLESSLRLVDITSVSFVTSETSDAYKFQVTLRTYWLK
jgi:Tfp pilus assembly protein PilO